MLLALPGEPCLKAGLLDGRQHIGVSNLYAELQVGARGAPLSQHSTPLVPNAGAGVSPPAIDPDPELNHDEPPAHSAS